MKAETTVTEALMKAHGWKKPTWESRLFWLLDRLLFVQGQIRDLAKNGDVEDECGWKEEFAELSIQLGEFIGSELLKSNHKVLLLAHQGWENLRKGKPFNPSKKRSDKAERAFWELQAFIIKHRCRPTRKELAEAAGLSRADMSEAVTQMGIEEAFLDGRQERHKRARKAR